MSWGLMALADMFFKDVSFFDGSPNVDLSSNHRNWKILIENMYNVRRFSALFSIHIYYRYYQGYYSDLRLLDIIIDYTYITSLVYAYNL